MDPRNTKQHHHVVIIGVSSTRPGFALFFGAIAAKTWHNTTNRIQLFTIIYRNSIFSHSLLNQFIHRN